MTWKMANSAEKCEKGERHTVGPGICREKRNKIMKNEHSRTWNMVRTLTNKEKRKLTL
jgi:hypothetical protein